MFRIIQLSLNKVQDMWFVYRRILYGFLLQKLGKKAQIHVGCRFLFVRNIAIGDRVFINFDTVIDGHGGVTIGNDVTIGPCCHIWTTNHVFANVQRPINLQGHITAPIKIEDDVWLGASVMILPGVTIGKGSVIGAGSVVTKDIPSFSIAVGNPAHIVKRRT